MIKNVMNRPKNEGMSFFIPEGHKVFDATGSDGAEVVILATSLNEANEYAREHFVDLSFNVQENVVTKLTIKQLNR